MTTAPSVARVAVAIPIDTTVFVMENYSGGGIWIVPRREWIILYREVGTVVEAFRHMDDFMRWPIIEGKRLRPPNQYIYEWAKDADNGAEVPDKLALTIIKRWEKHVAWLVKSASVEAARASRSMSKLAANGKLDPKFAPIFMHANNAAGFIWDKTHNGAAKTVAPQIQVGRLVISGPSGERKKKLPAGQVVDAEYKELPVGRPA